VAAAGPSSSSSATTTSTLAVTTAAVTSATTASSDRFNRAEAVKQLLWSMFSQDEHLEYLPLVSTAAIVLVESSCNMNAGCLMFKLINIKSFLRSLPDEEKKMIV
jgi:hypothetical protein